jgi:hypothetical protein
MRLLPIGMSLSLRELRERLSQVITNAYESQSRRTGGEFECHIDVSRVTPPDKLLVSKLFSSCLMLVSAIVSKIH